MSLISLHVRFLIIYTLSLILTGIVIQYFNLSGNIAFGIVLTMAISGYLAEQFAKKNDRYFTKLERKKVIGGFSLIVILFQVLSLMVNDKYHSIGIGGIAFALGLATLLSMAIVSASIDIVGKNLVKRDVLEEYPEGQAEKEKNYRIKNRFLRSFIRILFITLTLILIMIVSIPIVGELMK